MILILCKCAVFYVIIADILIDTPLTGIKLKLLRNDVVLLLCCKLSVLDQSELTHRFVPAL